MKKICSVVGARPNFMKMAPIILGAAERGFEQMVVHTGQHYDERMSKIFFEQLGMPRPDAYLGVGSGTHAEQTAKVMVEFNRVCEERRPALVIVAGDVNSTVACALVAAKLGIPVAHVESGLRSFDRTMPEEINRVITDHLSDLLFVTEQSGLDNLAKEGVSGPNVHLVGNTMIDSLMRHLESALALEPWKAFSVQPQEYGVVTLHRPSNVDVQETRMEIKEALKSIGRRIPLIFPAHPRTKPFFDDGVSSSGIKVVEPLGYIEFLGLMAKAKFVITDSGGIQEETTVLGVPCVTTRLNTERPVTVTEGTNTLVPPRASSLLEAVDGLAMKSVRIPKLWDGKASQRILDIIQDWLQAEVR